MIGVGVRQQNRIEVPHAKGQRLLPQVGPGIDQDAARTRARRDRSTDAGACRAGRWTGRRRSRSAIIGTPCDVPVPRKVTAGWGQGMMMREGSCGAVFVASTKRIWSS